jgi:hypothetical protein
LINHLSITSRFSSFLPLPYQFTPFLHLSSFFLFVRSVVFQTSVPTRLSFFTVPHYSSTNHRCIFFILKLYHLTLFLPSSSFSTFSARLSFQQTSSFDHELLLLHLSSFFLFVRSVVLFKLQYLTDLASLPFLIVRPLIIGAFSSL